MVRIPLLGAALTASLALAATPLASATGTQPVLPAQAPNHTYETPALGANMLGMSMCGARDDVVAELAQVFHETPVAVGQVDGNAVVEILVSETGSWTILATGTDGMSCIVSAGEGFESTIPVRGLDA